MSHPKTFALAALLGAAAFVPQAMACDQPLIDASLLQPAMKRYFSQLAKSPWDGGHPFSHIDGKRIYMSRDFDTLAAAQKKQLLSLLLLDYGEYKPLMQYLPAPLRDSVTSSGGAIPSFEVYSWDGRLVSLPYNGCNRMTLLTEYERSRIGFLGVNHPRVQRFPMSLWQQDQIKKLFWQSIGYGRAGDFWIAWVPESGHFEIDVPSSTHTRVLEAFWQNAPSYYRYVVVDKGQQLFARVRGKQQTP